LLTRGHAVAARQRFRHRAVSGCRRRQLGRFKARTLV